MKAISRFLCVSTLAVCCSSCGGGGIDITIDPPPPLPGQPQVTVEGQTKRLVFSWADVDGADHYRLMENPDGHSGFTQVGDNIPAGTLTVNRDIAVHLFDWVNAQYIVDACNVTGCNSSDVVTAADAMLNTIGYFKASNTQEEDHFGVNVELSADGNTLAVGESGEDSCAIGINGDQNNNGCENSGAVYLFRFDGTDWYQQAYIKASNTDAFSLPDDEFAGNDHFGNGVALSVDGNTLAVGASGEDSCAIGINGDQSDNSCTDSGAVYLFRFDGADWHQQAYIKPSSPLHPRHFCRTALSDDGNTLVVGASGEWMSSGAVYVFRFDGAEWYQEAYIKASNSEVGDYFGSGVALSADGNTLAVGAYMEDSSATGIDGNQDDNSSSYAGAVYVFRFDGADWSQQTYIKASNTDPNDRFGITVALSTEGNTLAVGAVSEDSCAIGINGDQNNNGCENSGAVYLFRFDGTDWYQRAYIKASNSETWDGFGTDIALSSDGETLAVGARYEDSSATGIDGDQDGNSAEQAGAVYLFRYDGTEWSQQAYIKAPNTDAEDNFGTYWGVSLSANGNTLAVGARSEDSSATGINGDQDDNTVPDAGAVFVY